jgi:uncharacterized protein YecT (DUF1311 family)
VRYVVRLGALATAAILAAGANAEEAKLSPQFEPCMDKAGGVTTAMVECIGAETERQDKRLNAAYKKAMAGLTPKRRQELQAVQRLWLQYRDAACQFAFDPDGGTMAHVESTGCFLNMTADRAQELEALAER